MDDDDDHDGGGGGGMSGLAGYYLGYQAAESHQATDRLATTLWGRLRGERRLDVNALIQRCNILEDHAYRLEQRNHYLEHNNATLVAEVARLTQMIARWEKHFHLLAEETQGYLKVLYRLGWRRPD